PHTLKETTLAGMAAGVEVNLEVDLLARYMERLMKGEAAAKSEGAVTEEFLQNCGFK
ncbi:MAG: riboflavin synthase, partial [Methylococcaceae bacterium]